MSQPTALAALQRTLHGAQRRRREQRPPMIHGMIEEAAFEVDGMDCASCIAHVEKAARTLPGVEDARVNLRTGGRSCSLIRARFHRIKSRRR